MSIEEKIKTAKEDSWLKDSVGEKEFKEIKDNERKMTNEEAKQIFLDRGFVNGIFDGNKWRESVIVISKWLKQEHCEDLISRQAVINALKDNSVEMGGMDFCGFGVYYDDIESIVNGVSSIEKNDINHYKIIDTSYSPYTIDSTTSSYSVTIPKVTEKTAYWIVKTDNEGTYGICPNCGKKQYAGLLNYCPDCGKRMIKE